MNHASGTVTPLDPELIQVGDAIGQRAQLRKRAGCRRRCRQAGQRLTERLVAESGGEKMPDTLGWGVPASQGRAGSDY